MAARIIIAGDDKINKCCSFVKDGSYKINDILFEFGNVDNYNKAKPFLKYLMYKLKEVKIEEKIFIEKYEFDDEKASFKLYLNVYSNFAMLRYAIFCYIRKCILSPSLVETYEKLVKAYPKYNKLHLFEISERIYTSRGVGSSYSVQNPFFVYKIYSLEEVIDNLKGKYNTNCQGHFVIINKKINNVINQNLTKKAKQKTDENDIEIAKILLKNRI